MVKPLLALTLFTTALTAAPAAANQATGEWTVAGSEEVCMIHQATLQGTTMSVTAMPGEEAFLFVIQNESLASLADGQPYPIAVEFDDKGPWQIEAIAQHELDRDGPGLIFAVRPGRDDGKNFIAEFTSASAMEIGREGAILDNLSLSNGRAAMTGLATCLGNIWAGGSAAAPGQDATGQGGPLIEVDEGAEGEQPVPL
jgi:hypothetical protein